MSFPVLHLPLSSLLHPLCHVHFYTQTITIHCVMSMFTPKPSPSTVSCPCLHHNHLHPLCHVHVYTQTITIHCVMSMFTSQPMMQTDGGWCERCVPVRRLRLRSAAASSVPSREALCHLQVQNILERSAPVPNYQRNHG